MLKIVRRKSFIELWLLESVFLFGAATRRVSGQTGLERKMKKHLSQIIFAATVLLTVGVYPVFAQSALDGFDPNADGTVRVVVVQPDGKILIGGDFITILGQPRNRIARLNPDGSLDTAFNPNADDIVFSIAVQPDGRVLVGGRFTNIGGQPRNHIARLDATTGLADSFNPNASNFVFSIALQSDGKVLAGGQFTNIGGQTRGRIARLNPDGSLDTAFAPNANERVFSVAMQPDGRVLAGGLFTDIGGQPRSRIARLDQTAGAADPTWNPNANNFVISIAVQPDGKILTGGAFTNIGGQTRNRIARLDAATGAADAWNPNADNAINSIALQPDGKVLASGSFTTIGTQSRNYIARLDTATGAADSFNPNASSDVLSIAVQSDGKVLASGAFTTIGGQTRNRIARLERDGSLDHTLGFNTDSSNRIFAIAIQPDGKILIGGQFTISGYSLRNIARLNPDGSLETTGFVPVADGIVYAIALQSDGKILVGGDFTNISGQQRYHIARLDGVTGMVDPTWNPNASRPVRSIAVQPDGKILVGGEFTSIGGQPRNFIARLDAATGAADPTWNPNPNVPNNAVYAMALQLDGKILVGGSFPDIGGQPRNNIARLDAVTGAADAWNPNPNMHSPAVNAIALQSDGKVLVGGEFTNIGGQTRFNFARLSNDIAAFSTLSVTTTTLTLTRDGSAPQFHRVIFERSTDNGANWTFLGTATGSFASLAANNKGENPFAPNAAGYTLTGQNIPTGQNVLIRARGFYRTGYFGGSETTEDKVRQVFLFPPTAVEVSIGGRVLTADGRGIFRARVSITDTAGETRTALTNPFGFYRFDEIPVGATYVLSVSHKRYQFSPQILTVTEDVAELNFIAATQHFTK